jgi:hypothetical protein
MYARWSSTTNTKPAAPANPPATNTQAKPSHVTDIPPDTYLTSKLLNRDTLLPEAKQLPPESTWTNPTGTDEWDLKDVAAVKRTHKPTEGAVDTMAWWTIKCARFGFDLFSGYLWGSITEKKVLRRVCFLETVAGVPGMVAGMLRHMTSLRRLKRDHGWIHTLLTEAENERMHLLTFLELRKPTIVFRCAVLITQGIFFNVFFLMYLCSPRFCHRLVGYLEEEAVHTYTEIIAEIDKGKIFQNIDAPKVAKAYWQLPADAKMRELFVAVRADEAEHKLVNHTFADMHAHGLHDRPNPFRFMKHQTSETPQK